MNESCLVIVWTFSGLIAQYTSGLRRAAICSFSTVKPPLKNVYYFPWNSFIKRFFTLTGIKFFSLYHLHFTEVKRCPINVSCRWIKARILRSCYATHVLSFHHCIYECKIAIRHNVWMPNRKAYIWWDTATSKVHKNFDSFRHKNQTKQWIYLFKHLKY